MVRKTSHSQSVMFWKCPRTWYMKYIKKVPGIENLMYANGGQCLHRPIDKYYSEGKPTLGEIKNFFEKLWNIEYNMNETDIAHKKDSYWLQVMEAVNLNIELSHSELKIEYDDILAYIDGWDENRLEILDWKSSTRSEENEHEYMHQLKFYSYLIYRTYKVIPKKATVYYLKYKGTKQTLSFTPTIEDIKEAAAWHKETLMKMDYYIKNPDKLPPFNQGYHWSPYKHFWEHEESETLRYMLHITGGKARLQGPITKLLDTQLCRKFHYEPKTAFHTKKYTPWKDTMVRLWNTKDQTLPIGLLEDLYKTLFDYGKHIKKNVVIDITDHRKFNDTKVAMPDKLLNGKELRPYQNEAVEKYIRRENNSTFEIATGGGKSLIAAECIRRLKMKTLFVVDKRRLLLQTKQVFEEALGIEIGQVGDGIKDFKDVTVATIQTLSKDLMKYRNELSQFRFLILDESHHSASTSYYRLSDYVPNTEYRLCLTATNRRDDGNDLMLKGIAGKVLFKEETKTLIDKKYLVKPTIIFFKNYLDSKIIKEMEQNINPNKKVNEEDKYEDFYNTFIVKGDVRNQLIKIASEKYNGKKILILTKSIEHGRHLSTMIEGSKHIHGSTHKKLREESFKDFVEGKFNILISTISIFVEGVDIPSLDVIILASAHSGEIRTIQALGRVLRTMEGKTDAYYIDFFDNMKMLSSASVSRWRALKKEGHTLKALTLNQFLGVEEEPIQSTTLKDFGISTKKKEDPIKPPKVENTLYIP